MSSIESKVDSGMRRNTPSRRVRSHKSDVAWSTVSSVVPYVDRYLPVTTVHTHCKWTFSNTFLTTSTTLNAYGAKYFTLDQVSDYTSLVAVYDQYRIREVEVWLQPNYGTNNEHSGSVVSVIDYDDATVPSVFTDLYEYQNAIFSPMTYGHYRRFTPRIAVAAYQTGGFTGYSNQSSTWIDCAYPAVQHLASKQYLNLHPAAPIFIIWSAGC